MGVPYTRAEESLDEAVKTLFADPAVRSVGIGQHERGFGYFAVRNSAQILPQGGVVALGIKKLKPHPKAVNDVPVVVRDTPQEVEAHLKLPFSGPGSPAAASHVIEQQTFRPLCAGLQIQNFDDDVRTGVLAGGHIIIGTLGCFVKLTNGKEALLSNNHVVAGENRGKKGHDRILQAGGGSIAPPDPIATLTNFVTIKPSPAGASVVAGTAVLNLVDAGVAKLEAGIAFAQGYHPTRHLVTPTGYRQSEDWRSRLQGGADDRPDLR